MYLVDTNIWLERLLSQEHSEDVGKFLDRISSEQLFTTDFSLHSICLILTRLKRPNIVIDFVNDLFVQGSVGLLTVPPHEIGSVIEVIAKLDLDFDDAYQYLIAERDNLTLVTLDSDFARTPRVGKTPAQVLEQL